MRLREWLRAFRKHGRLVTSEHSVATPARTASRAPGADDGRLRVAAHTTARAGRQARRRQRGRPAEAAAHFRGPGLDCRGAAACARRAGRRRLRGGVSHAPSRALSVRIAAQRTRRARVGPRGAWGQSQLAARGKWPLERPTCSASPPRPDMTPSLAPVSCSQQAKRGERPPPTASGLRLESFCTGAPAGSARGAALPAAPLEAWPCSACVC